MPPKGFKKPRTLTTQDYAISLQHMQAILHNAMGLAMRHPDLPRMAVLHTIAVDADKELSEAASAALRHETADSSEGRPIAPAATQVASGLSADQDGER